MKKEVLKILVTAGSTWVAIDKVRVITNIFGGALGVKISQELVKKGNQVTLLIGPGRAILPEENEKLKIVKFKYYDDLLELMKDHLISHKYDVVIHSAAVSDYKPKDVYDGKIKSGKPNSIIELVPTIKIVDLIKDIDPKILLIKFKLEVGVSREELVNIAYKSLKASRADYIVANEFSETSENHKAYIINKSGEAKEYIGKASIAEAISNLING